MLRHIGKKTGSAERPSVKELGKAGPFAVLDASRLLFRTRTAESVDLTDLPQLWPTILMAYIVVAYIVMAYILMVYIVMAYIVMDYRIMAYIVMAYAVTA